MGGRGQQQPLRLMPRAVLPVTAVRLTLTHLVPMATFFTMYSLII